MTEKSPDPSSKIDKLKLEIEKYKKIFEEKGGLTDDEILELKKVSVELQRLGKVIVRRSTKRAEGKKARRDAKMERRGKYTRQLRFLGQMIGSAFNVDLTHQFEKGKVTLTNIDKMDFQNLDRKRKEIGSIGNLEVMIQEGETPDFETSIPQIIDIHAFPVSENLLAWMAHTKKTIRSVADVMEFVKDNFSSHFYLAGVDYLEFIYEKKKSDPHHLAVKVFDDGSDAMLYNFMPGALFRDIDGENCVPYVLSANEAELIPFAHRFNMHERWVNSFRIVLLPKEPGTFV